MGILTQNCSSTADAASLDSDDLDDEKPAPKPVPRKNVATAKATISKRSSKASTPAKSTTSSRGKEKQKAKIEYLSDDGDGDFVEDEVSEYEDFEGDDDNVSDICLVCGVPRLTLLRSCMNQIRITYQIIPSKR